MSTFTGTIPVVHVWVYYQIPFTVWFGIMLFLSIFGAALNYLLFAAIISTRKLRTDSGALIAYTILLDGAMCAPVLPLLTASTWMGQYGFPSDTLCRWFMVIFCVVVWTTTWAPLPIAVNRFVAVCCPHYYDSCVSKNTLPPVILFSWTISLCCAVSMFLEIGAKFGATKPWGACGGTVTQPASYTLLTAMGTTVPTVIQGAIYLALFMIYYARKFSRSREVSAIQNPAGVDGSGMRSAALQRRRFKVTKMVFAAYLWATACYMSTPVVPVAAPQAYHTYPMVSLVTRALLLLGYATSPVRIFEAELGVSASYCSHSNGFSCASCYANI